MSVTDPKKSNYTKRNKKTVTEDTSLAPISGEDSYPHAAIDVIDSPEGFKVVEVVYNLETGRAKISRIKEGSRLVGLQFNQQKRALRVLSKL